MRPSAFRPLYRSHAKLPLFVRGRYPHRIAWERPVLAHAHSRSSPLARSPDHGDSVFGDGDKVRVFFDQATDRAQAVDAGDKAFVDGLFSFSLPLGLEYMGEWEDDSTFAVTV